MKTYIVSIGVGILNLLHGIFHLIQFTQSVLLINQTHNHSSIWTSILWAIVGMISLGMGMRDYLHHKKCKRV